MKNVTRPLSVISFVSMLMIAAPSFAGDGHSHGHDNSDGHHADSGMSGMSDMSGQMSEQMGGMFLVKKEIDGYEVSFHVTKAQPGKEMGGTHDLMIEVEKDGKAVTDVVMNTKVVHPNGQSETKQAMKMGDWMMAGYDLGHEGKHQMMILFKTPDGKKHKGGVYYSDN